MKRIKILPSGYGHWKISTEIQGKEMSAITNDALLIDDLRDDFEDRTYYTESEDKAENVAYDIITEANLSFDKNGIAYDRDGDVVEL